MNYQGIIHVVIVIDIEEHLLNTALHVASEIQKNVHILPNKQSHKLHEHT